MSASMGSRIIMNCGRILLQRSREVCNRPTTTAYGLHRLFKTHCSLSSCAKRYDSYIKKPLVNTSVIQNSCRSLSTLTNLSQIGGLSRLLPPSHLPQVTPCRTKVRFSMKKGKPKTVKAVVQRFYRLDWGGWIRPRAGRGKRLWKKSLERKYRLRQHVFCTKNQSKLLSAMVTDYWKRPRHYVDDPYAPYHKRINFDKGPLQKPPFLP